ncbi:MAG: TonB-dependent receptor [Burkholderiaceae bacterium]|nr:TonB-dependent receptor [Burkholderiaceae bacterium]
MARATAEGVELSAEVRRGPWQLQGNGTYLDARDESSDLPLVRRAPWTVNLGAFHDQGRWRLGGEVSWVDARDDFDDNTFAARKTLPSLRAARGWSQFKVTAHLSLKLRAENLLDERYTLVDGYNTWGRALFGGIEWRL